MVACKRNGTKPQRGGGPMLVQEKTRVGSMHERHDHVGKGTKASANDVSNSGLPREAERKLSSIRILERIQVISVFQKRSNEPMTQAQAHSGHSSKIKADAVNDYKAQKGFVISKPNKSNQRGSMKGKKVIVRLKASQFDITSAMEGELPKSSPLSHPQKCDFFFKN